MYEVAAWFSERIDDDFHQIEKTQAALEARFVYPLLVSEQPKLHRSGPPESQPTTNASADGS